VPLIDPAGGEITRAHIFMVVWGTSNYTYAEATATKSKTDWTAADVLYRILGERLGPAISLAPKSPAGRWYLTQSADSVQSESPLEGSCGSQNQKIG